jgi:transcriptional regulator with XRE-family HTH domain
MPATPREPSQEDQPSLVGMHIRRLREALGKTQEDLEIALKEDFQYPLDRTNIGRLENGKRGITAIEVSLFAHILGVSSDELLWGTANPTNEQILAALQLYKERFATQRALQKKDTLEKAPRLKSSRQSRSGKSPRRSGSRKPRPKRTP